MQQETDSGTLLAVDDEPSVLNVLRGVLTRAGYQVLPAEHPAKALEIFEKQRTSIRLLITDVVMPGMSGMELADRLTELDPGLKVLLIAGMPDHPKVIAAVTGKGYAFMPKPFLPQQLVEKVRALLGESQCRSACNATP